jgi:beta-glucosidase
VLYSRGLPEMNDVFQSTHWEGGVIMATFPSQNFTGTPETVTLSNISGYRQERRRGPRDDTPRSVHYSGTYKAAKTGKYVILAASLSRGGDEFTVMVDGKQLPAPPHAEGQAPLFWTIDLTAGQRVHLIAECLPPYPDMRFGLGIAYEADLITPEAKEFAAKADVAVVAAGFDARTEGEGADRAFELPWGQDALIEAVAAANPHTIVTLTGGGGMDTRPWLGKVPALLHVYYPGQEGGTAIAEVLVKYDDGLMVGYRYWTTTGKHPLYPFGFGLSYTAFSFSKLEVPATAASGSMVPVSFDVTNTGKVAGADVAQLYVSDPSAKVKRPERELKGFEKVRLAPGETKHVTLNLDARAFSYWDATAHKWTIDPGKFVIRVGDSSESTPLNAEVTLK